MGNCGGLVGDCGGLVEHGDAVEPALGEPCTEAVRAARIGLASEERLEGLPAGRQLRQRARAAAEAPHATSSRAVLTRSRPHHACL